MLAVRLSDEAIAFIRRLDTKRQRQVAEKIQKLQEDPITGTIKLTGYEFRRARAGDYRIVYDVFTDEDGFETLDVLYVDSRDGDEVYKILKRNYRNQ